MGIPKARLVFDGETLLQRTIRIAGEAGCAPVIAVVGAGDPGPLDAQVVQNLEAEEGMASSIRAGIAALSPAAERVLLLTVDQIAVDAALLRRLVALSGLDVDRPAACAYAGTLGIPAVLPRRLFPDLLALRGDRGAKAILAREGAAALPFPEGSLDLDVPTDLERFRR